MPVVLAQPARTDRACDIVVDPSTPASPWRDAVERARVELAKNGEACRTAHLTIDGDGATLEFMTRDGRLAVRPVRQPDELVPTLDALLVPLPAPAPTPTIAETSPTESDKPTGQTPPDNPSASLLLSALAGGRVSAPDGYLSFNLALGASLILKHWELGIVAQANPAYRHLDDDDLPNARLSDIGAGIIAGRRIPLGDVTVIAGGSLSASILHEKWSPAIGDPAEQEAERGQALVGVFASASFPAHWSTRFRTTLSGDVDATHLGGAIPTPGDPVLPWCGFTLAMGVESGAF